ncbi:MAG TPA: ATP-binding cassette domain-containing protein, partial [Iamia sp.]|nr:ATP-binding cassette domain-containing protein [Iamia sp.]
AAIALVLTAAVGALFALPALRLGGLALALSTLALALVGETIVFAYKPFTNGTYGWTVLRPTIGPIDLGTDRALAVFLWILVLAVVVLVANLRRSPSGRAILAVRSTEVASASVGVSMPRAKLRVFTLSAVVAGLGGIMYATVNGSAVTASFPAQVGLSWLAIVVLMGVRRPAGAVLAGIVFVFSPEVIGLATDSGRIQEILFGLGAVQLATSPDGILTAVTAARARRRRAGEAIAAAEAEAAVGASDDLAARTPTDAADLAPIGGALLQLRGVRSGYGEVEVLHGIDLDVAAGRITVLLGAGGAGKSTFCGTVAGAVGVDAGTLHFLGEDITAAPAHRRSRMGLAIAPESRGIFPGLSVTENLAVALRDPGAREQALERFPALGRRHRVEAGYLSGGEQQMLALAPLVIDPPRLLIVDEPGLGLAPLVVDEVLRLLTELRDAGSTILLSEEKASRVLGVADDVAFLTLGRVVWSGPAAEVDLDRLTDAYLEARR